MNGLGDYISDKRKIIESTLRDFLRKKEGEFGSVNVIGGDFSRRLLEFSLGGKMIRGILVFLGYDVFTKRVGKLGSTNEELLVSQAAAAMEILQSGLLIHDDIMDRDVSRRGKDSFHVQYEKYISSLSDKTYNRDLSHFAESLAICAGDIAFFLSFELLTRYPFEGKNDTGLADRVVRLVLHYSRELSLVGIGQMEDVSLGLTDSGLEVERVLNLYRYKTSRYTFSLPLIIGAIIAGDVDDKTIALLNEIGESLGILFQIRDDELGIFGEKDTLGKPIGSDIREGKRNLIYVLLRKAIQDDRIDRVSGDRIYTLWGSDNITVGDVQFVSDVVRESGVVDELNRIIERYSRKVFTGIGLLRELDGVLPDRIDILEEFVNFVLKRDK